MGLDKINLLNSEDSEKDPPMTDDWSTSDGETIEQRMQNGTKWTTLLKEDGEAYNVVHRRLIVAIARKRFTDDDVEQSKWVRDIKDTLEAINRPANANIIYWPQRSDTKRKKKQKPIRYDVDDSPARNEPESMHVLNGRRSNINDFDDSENDLDVEDFEHSSKAPKASAPKGRQFQNTGDFTRKKTNTKSEREQANETLSKFSQAASAIEPSEDGNSIFSGKKGKNYSRKKTSARKLDDEEDTYRTYSARKMNQQDDGEPRSKKRRRK